jgi:Fe-S-cluster containining protein
VLQPGTHQALFAFASAEFAASYRTRSARDAVEVGEHVGLWFDEAMAQAPRPPSPYACARGCAYCCHLKVIATPPEVIAITTRLRERLSREALAAVRARVVETDRKTHGLSSGERARSRLACPLLVDGECVAYDVRPASCRVANSFDPGACKRAFESDEEISIPQDAEPRSWADALRGAAASSAFEAKLDPRMLELVAALKIGLEQSDAPVAWARGNPVFAKAVDREFAANLERRRGG